jgi:uncharacterized protein YbcI
MFHQWMADVTTLDLTRHVRCALENFFEQRMGARWPTEVSIVGDLIVLRCKEALSPSEVNLGTMKAGRLLLQEVSDSLCRELQPDLDKLLREITGLRLVDICVGFFLERRERIYLFTMSDTVKCQSEQFARSR